jgi:hypothetical protein
MLSVALFQLRCTYNNLDLRSFFVASDHADVAKGSKDPRCIEIKFLPSVPGHSKNSVTVLSWWKFHQTFFLKFRTDKLEYFILGKP